jgi:hypothetical protein
LTLLLESFFPTPLQLAGHQSVLRLAGLVLASGTLRFIAGSFDPQIPVLQQFGPLAFDIGHGGGSFGFGTTRGMLAITSAKSASLELSFEARDAQHAQAIIAGVRAAGFEPTILPA